MASFMEIWLQRGDVVTPRDAPGPKVRHHSFRREKVAKVDRANNLVDTLLSPAKVHGRYASVRPRSSSNSSPTKSKGSPTKSSQRLPQGRTAPSKRPVAVADSRSRTSSTTHHSGRPHRSPTRLASNDLRKRIPEESQRRSRYRKSDLPSRGQTGVRQSRRTDTTTAPPPTMSGRPSTTNSSAKAANGDDRSSGCSVCMESIPERQMHELSCSHFWCRDCCIAAFELSTTDPSSMPPQCCKSNEVHINTVRQTWHGLFSTEFKKLWARKYAESKETNPVYCPRKGCSSWIPQDMFSQDTKSKKPPTAHCPKCHEKVCRACKLKSHGEKPCPVDKSTKEVLEMIKKDPQSQQCPKCRNGVSKTTGCNHMSCVCGCEFCLKCGEKWRGENCRNGCPYIEMTPDPEEDRRFAENIHRQIFAEALHQNQIPRGPRPPPPPPPHMARFHQAADPFGLHGQRERLHHQPSGVVGNPPVVFFAPPIPPQRTPVHPEPPRIVRQEPPPLFRMPRMPPTLEPRHGRNAVPEPPPFQASLTGQQRGQPIPHEPAAAERQALRDILRTATDRRSSDNHVPQVERRRRREHRHDQAAVLDADLTLAQQMQAAELGMGN